MCNIIYICSQICKLTYNGKSVKRTKVHLILSGGILKKGRRETINGEKLKSQKSREIKLQL